MHDLRALAARGAEPRREGDARCDPRIAGRRLHVGDLEQPARQSAALSVEAHGAGRRDRARLRGRAAATAAGRAELHVLNYTAAHATYPLKCMLTPQRARQCRLLPPVHGEGAGGLDPQLHEAGVGQPAHAHRLVYRAQHLPRAGRRGARRRCRPPPACRSRSTSTAATATGAVYSDHFFMGGGQGALAARRRQVRPAVADLGRQHLDRAVGGARSGAGAGEILRRRFRRTGPASRRLRRARRACASWTTTACRHWHRCIPKASASRWTGLHGGLPGGGVRGVVLDPDGNVVHDCGTGELVTLDPHRPDRRSATGGRRGLWRSAHAAGRAGGAGCGGRRRVAGGRGSATTGC